MKLAVPIHTDLSIEVSNEPFDLTEVLKPELGCVNDFKTDTKEISIEWVIAFFCTDFDNPVAIFSLTTTCKVIEVFDYDTDISHIKSLVIDSFERFSYEIGKTGLGKPRVDPSFGEIALRILESLTFSGYY